MLVNPISLETWVISTNGLQFRHREGEWHPQDNFHWYDHLFQKMRQDDNDIIYLQNEEKRLLESLLEASKLGWNFSKRLKSNYFYFSVSYFINTASQKPQALLTFLFSSISFWITKFNLFLCSICFIQLDCWKKTTCHNLALKQFLFPEVWWSSIGQQL